MMVSAELALRACSTIWPASKQSGIGENERVRAALILTALRPVTALAAIASTPRSRSLVTASSRSSMMTRASPRSISWVADDSANAAVADEHGVTSFPSHSRACGRRRRVGRWECRCRIWRPGRSGRGDGRRSGFSTMETMAPARISSRPSSVRIFQVTPRPARMKENSPIWARLAAIRRPVRSGWPKARTIARAASDSPNTDDGDGGHDGPETVHESDRIEQHADGDKEEYGESVAQRQALIRGLFG